MFSAQELYAYSARVRRRFAEKLAQMPWSEVSKNREASFYSMKDILLHMIDNEDWIVNWVIFNKSLDYKKDREFADYADMAQILSHLSEVENKTRKYFAGADEVELKRRVNFTLKSGKSFDLSVEEALFQSFTEQIYHLGEIIALLWQDNIEPPQMQWFWNNPRIS